MPGDRKRILAIRDGALGDFIVTLPALEALRRVRPDAELHLISRPAYVQLAVAFGLVESGRSIESASIAPLFRAGGTADWLGGYDAAWTWLKDPEGVFRTNLHQDGLCEVHQMPWSATTPGVPAARQLAAVLELTRWPFAFDFSRCQISSAAILDQDKRWIALHPGSGSSRKNWPWDRWMAVLRYLHLHRPRLGFVIVTGEVEEPSLLQMLAALQSGGLVHVHAHACPLPELARILKECRAFLGHDSGVAHLAAACGLPCRVLFGPSDAAIWSPQGPDTKILEAPGGRMEDLDIESVTRFVDDLEVDTAPASAHDFSP